MNFTTLRTACALILVSLLLAGCATSSAREQQVQPDIREGRWVSVATVMEQPIPNDYLNSVHSHGTKNEQVFIGSVRYNQFWLYVNRQVVLHGPLGTGSTMRGYATPRGVHSIFRIEGEGYTSKTYPKPRGGAPMGFALFFTKEGEALHASANYRSRTSRVTGDVVEEMCINCSHGCANLRYHDARIVHMYLRLGDKVVILD